MFFSHGLEYLVPEFHFKKMEMQTNYSQLGILICDDHEVFRAGLVRMFRDIGNIQVLAEARSAADLLKLTERLKPDMVLTAANLPAGTGIQAIETITRKHPRVPVLAISSFQHDDVLLSIVRAGARGCLVRTADEDEVKSAINALSSNRHHYSSNLLIRLAYLLSQRELDACNIRPKIVLNQQQVTLLRLICTGLYMKEIAAKMKMNVRTLETQKAKLYKAIGQNTIVGLMHFAIRNGIYYPE
jgi:DNA-binding NarL/FixJ family response regulator